MYHRFEGQCLKFDTAADALEVRDDHLDVRLDGGAELLSGVLGIVGHLHVDVASVGQDLVDMELEVDTAARSELFAWSNFVRLVTRLLGDSAELSLVGNRVDHFGFASS
jgi:hypothetical protein